MIKQNLQICLNFMKLQLVKVICINQYKENVKFKFKMKTIFLIIEQY